MNDLFKFLTFFFFLSIFWSVMLYSNVRRNLEWQKTKESTRIEEKIEIAPKTLQVIESQRLTPYRTMYLIKDSETGKRFILINGSQGQTIEEIK